MPYTGGVPHNGTDTSIAAAKSQSGKATVDRIKIFELIKSCGDQGCTCDEAETRLGMLHQTASARIRDLHKLHIIRDSGDRRKTRTGRSARVYIVTKVCVVVP